MTTLKLKESKAENIKLFIEQNKEDKLDLRYDVLFEDSEDFSFKVVFSIAIFSGQNISIFLDYACSFHLDSPITDDFKNSDFPFVNAPAISFPFLRSFVSFLTLNAGYNPIILPSINFQDLAKKQNFEKSVKEK